MPAAMSQRGRTQIPIGADELLPLPGTVSSATLRIPGISACQVVEQVFAAIP